MGFCLEVYFFYFFYFLLRCTEQFLSTSEEVTNVRVSPLLQPNFTKLPPALIIVAEIDPLRDACYGELRPCHMPAMVS